jgi:hypothetical protein
MALSKTFTHAGLTIEDGYLRVSNFSGSKDGILFVLSYQVTAEEAALTTKEFSFVPTMGSNFIAQAYEHLKALPEFEGAEDC